MIYLKLFLAFLKIGIVSFGGGYGMISLIRDDCLKNGWLTESELLNFIAVAESTPGPIAVNMATFVGSSQGGFFGALLATLGVVLPSFIIISLIASVLTHFLKYKGVKAVLRGIKPAIAALIIGTAFTMFLKVILGFTSFGQGVSFDHRALLIFIIIALLPFAYKLMRKKALSPILLIIASGVLGILFYGF
jgi:chromate transporter